MVEQSAVNRLVVGSNPTWGVRACSSVDKSTWLRTTESGVRIPSSPISKNYTKFLNNKNNNYRRRDSNSHNVMIREPKSRVSTNFTTPATQIVHKSIIFTNYTLNKLNTTFFTRSTTIVWNSCYISDNNNTYT